MDETHRKDKRFRKVWSWAAKLVGDAPVLAGEEYVLPDLHLPTSTARQQFWLHRQASNPQRYPLRGRTYRVPLC
jgi:hypothetical protein